MDLFYPSNSTYSSYYNATIIIQYVSININKMKAYAFECTNIDKIK